MFSHDRRHCKHVHVVQLAMKDKHFRLQLSDNYRTDRKGFTVQFRWGEFFFVESWWTNQTKKEGLLWQCRGRRGEDQGSCLESLRNTDKIKLPIGGSPSSIKPLNSQFESHLTLGHYKPSLRFCRDKWDRIDWQLIITMFFLWAKFQKVKIKPKKLPFFKDFKILKPEISECPSGAFCCCEICVRWA